MLKIFTILAIAAILGPNRARADDELNEIEQTDIRQDEEKVEEPQADLEPEPIDLSQYRISSICLSKSESIGAAPDEEDESQITFNHTDLISESLSAHLMPYKYTYCVDSKQRLVSLQMQFSDPENPDAEPVLIPQAGPTVDGIDCKSKLHGNRSYPKLVRIFKDQDSDRIIGFGVMFSQTDLFKFGAPSSQAIDVEIRSDQHIVGFFGAQNDQFLTQLGIVIQDVNCTIAEAEQMRIRREEKRLADLATGENGSFILLLVVITVVIVIVIVVVFSTLIFFKKLALKRYNKIEVLKQAQSKHKAPSGNASQSLPNIETDDDPHRAVDTKRSLAPKEKSASSRKTGEEIDPNIDDF